MLTAHEWVAYAVIAVAGLAAAWGGITYFRRAEAGASLGHVLALVQTVCVAQVALGLLLVGDGRRTADDLHYVYGTLTLLVVLAPWFYAPTDPRRRLAWFAGTSLVAAALAVRAWTTSG
jgi:hypothetical protein